ncbi:MAG: hypothetical protein LIO76_04265, partial [Clostridiales bacterium]|nr:hypothetical protein [Clostridiales bacterium]
IPKQKCSLPRLNPRRLPFFSSFRLSSLHSAQQTPDIAACASSVWDCMGVPPIPKQKCSLPRLNPRRLPFCFAAALNW